MPYFKTSQEWLEQSVLLIEARPTTTRITTRYTIKSVKPPSSNPGDDATAGGDASVMRATSKPPRASLVIKTYDPVSGVTLKYRTTKAAEVSRLIYSALGQLGRAMAALPVDVPGAGTPGAPARSGDNANTEAKVAAETAVPTQQPQQPSQAGGGHKKKKGRK
ncbi:hypothetical protein DCS_06524 [Drechmeria coniospora]|uniref:SRP9 domain-containing protein n=1 Tax=Drechmeria coniospora TaxID=98403 RepID=A0A151GBY2_DRECN|nr:hypothetical protein DCS_06524 [Drechmeria coniospora]KYK54564.1 hypothetical protein DCS_06524 [Drechmeria coniospora]ODA80510.1 hypothetical protein RJ55_03468 [Drechmeria coniospora]